MSVPASPLNRADLPAALTPATLRRLPLATLRRLADPHNGILDPDEQRAFDAAIDEVMRRTAKRLSHRMDGMDWAAVRRVAARIGQHPTGSPSRADRQLGRIVRRIGEQVGLAQALAPGVDWSFAPSAAPERAATPSVPISRVPSSPEPAEIPEPAGPAGAADATDTADDHGTVDDLERRLTDQVEMVALVNDLDDAGRRTLALEQQRDLQSTRGVFFGFVVSVAVLVAGWAPLVAADDWGQRLWIIGLTLGTCALAGGVYGLVRMRQNRSAVQDAP